MEDDQKYSDSFRGARADNEQSGQPKKSPDKRRRGRPAKKIDLVELEKLASMQCTDDEIAGYFIVDRRTITRKKKQREFREAFERGKAKGRISVRRRLFQEAQSDKPGSLAAAIYLHKRFGYRDVPVAEAQEPETEAQRESCRKEALRKIRQLYGLDPDLPE